MFFFFPLRFELLCEYCIYLGMIVMVMEIYECESHCSVEAQSESINTCLLQCVGGQLHRHQLH